MLGHSFGDRQLQFCCQLGREWDIWRKLDLWSRQHLGTISGPGNHSSGVSGDRFRNEYCGFHQVWILFRTYRRNDCNRDSADYCLGRWNDFAPRRQQRHDSRGRPDSEHHCDAPAKLRCDAAHQHSLRRDRPVVATVILAGCWRSGCRGKPTCV